jgi:hypothetical protein
VARFDLAQRGNPSKAHKQQEEGKGEKSNKMIKVSSRKREEKLTQLEDSRISRHRKQYGKNLTL